MSSEYQDHCNANFGPEDIPLTDERSTPSSDETAAPIAWQYEWRLRLYSIENYGKDYGWKSTLSNNEPKNLLVEVRNVVPLYASPATALEQPWPDPTPEMLRGDPLFDAIWNVIKTWDINVPHAYSGYCGATGNHVRAIYDAIKGNALTAGAV